MTYVPQGSVLGQLLILVYTQSIVYDWRLYGCCYSDCMVTVTALVWLVLQRW